MAAEEASDDSEEYESRSSSELVDEESGRPGVYSERSDAVGGPTQSFDIAGDVLDADAEAGTKTEHPVADSEDPMTRSATSEGPSERGETIEENRQPKQRQGSDVLENQVFQEAPVERTNHAGVSSGATASGDIAGQRSDGEGTASGQNPGTNLGGSTRNSASIGDSAFATETAIPSTESGLRKEQLTQSRSSADQLEGLSQAEHAATFAEDIPMPLSFGEGSTRGSFAGESIETASLSSGSEGCDSSAVKGATVWPLSGEVGGVLEADGATAVLPNVLDDSSFVAAGKTRSIEDGVKPDPHQPPSSYDLTQHPSRGCEGYPAAARVGGGTETFAEGSDLGRVSHIVADAQELVNEVISNSLVAIVAAMAAMAQDNKSPKQELATRTADLQDLTRFDEDSPLFGKAGCPEEVSHNSSRVQAQKEEPAWPLYSSGSAPLPMTFVEDFLSHVYEVASAMGAAAAAATTAKATTPAIAEKPQSVVAIDETLPEVPSGVDDEPVDPPIPRESPEQSAEPESGEESLVNESLRLSAGENPARPTIAPGGTDQRPTEEVDRGEGQGKTEISHILASPSDDALPRSLSASVRDAVVADYLSEAISVSMLVTKVSPSNCSVDLEAPPSTEGITDVSRGLCLGKEGLVSRSALINESLPARQPEPKRPRSPGNEPTRQEEKDKGVAETAIRDTTSGTTPTALSEPLRSAIVEEYMSETLHRIVAAASPRAGEPVDAEIGAQSDQSLEKQRGSLAGDRDDRDRQADDTSDSPRPTSTPDKQRPSEADADFGPEVLVPRNAAAGCKSPACRPLEASAYLFEMGERAKRMLESSDESRADASSWLRDTGSKALSSLGGEQATRKASAVVEDYLLDTIRRAVMSEAAAGTAVAAPSSSSRTCAPADMTVAALGDHFTRDVSSRCSPGASDDGHHPTVDANDAGPGGEEFAQRPALCSSLAEGGTLVGGQASEDRWETSPKDSGHDRDDESPDAVSPPTLGSPSEEMPSDICPKVEHEVPFDPNHVSARGSPAPQSIMAAAYLVEAGTRAKSLQESFETSRDDASSWLRETGSKALSSPGGEQSARKASTVVEEYLLETLRGVVASEAAAGTAIAVPSSSPRTCADPDVTKVAKRDQAAPRASIPHDSVPTATTGSDVEADSHASGEVSVSLMASCSPIAQATKAIGQGRDEALPKEEGEKRRGGGEQTSNGPGPPIPPSPRDKGMERSDARTRQDSAEFSVPNVIFHGGRSPASRSAETLIYLTGVGSRAKSLQEAADWLVRAGGRAKSAEGRANRDRDDASSWLREAAVEALSLPGTSQDVGEAAECVLRAGGRAKSAQDCVEQARINASSWLREKGGRALLLSDTEQAQRSECAAWLFLAGGRAKSAQGRANKAREEASSWLRSTGLGAVSRQDRAEGSRSDAVAWLKSKGTSELERTGPVEGLANVLVEAALASGQGKPEAEESGHPSQCGGLNESLVNASGSPRTGYHPDITATELVGSGSSGRGIDQDTPPGDNVAVQPLQRPSSDSKSSNVHPAVTNGTSTPSPPRQAPPLVEGEAAATSATPTAADATRTDFEQPPGRTASTDRTAPAPWLEPATTPLVSTAAGTEDFGRMLGAGEKEWARVSLSRTPPFDALNSPSLPVRYAPVRGRPRPLPPDAEVFQTGEASAAPVAAEADAAVAAVAAGEAVHRRMSGGGAGAAHNADGSGWMEFFAPPDQMAPRGDAYRGSDGYGSAEASASTTVRADPSSAGSSTSNLAVGPRRERGGTDDPHELRQRDDEDREGDYNDHAWRFSGDGGGDGGGVGRRSPEEDWGESLGEVSHPAGEAYRRMVDRVSVASGGRWDDTGSFSPASRENRGNGGGISGHRAGEGKRWHKKAEQSRQYMRRWEAFLGRTHRYFDGEADVRKRMSLVRRAHPDVSNEVAYVALAQSRGRSSEAAAVLHLPRAKDEAAMVAMMLDVASFIHLARQAAERRRRSRQLERQRQAIAVAGRGEARGLFRRKGGADGNMPQSPTSVRQEVGEERWRGGGCEKDVMDAKGYKHDMATDDKGCRQRLGQKHRRRETSLELLPAGARKKSTNMSSSSSSSSSSSNGDGDDGRSRGKLQSRRSDSAPSLLPPIEGPLTEGTPPSPGSLKAVLSTSKSVAVEVPVGLGFARKAGRSKKDESFEQDRRGSNRSRRDLKAMLWARARWQRERMAEMSAPGKQYPPHKKEGGVETLDALMERFLCETGTLDRDSQDLNARLRGRQEKQGFGGRSLCRDSAGRSTGRQAGSGTTFGGNGGNSSTGHGLLWRDLNGLDGCQQPSSKTSLPLFLASVNSNLAAPFMFLSEGGERVEGACFTASSVAAASVCSLVEAGECSRDRGSCRVQSYFAQALGDESLCGPKDGHHA